ncbi:immunoglobulin domain-containing protein [Spirosoma flavus]
MYSLFRCLLLIVSTFAALTFTNSAAYAIGDVVKSSGAAPTITSHPASSTVCPGQPTTLSVAATGTALTYQWRKNGTNLNGATSASYTIATVLPEDAGNYDVVVGSSTGPATSNPARLTVRPYTLLPTPPVGQTVTVGSPVTFSAVATGDITGYQWLKNDVAIPGATSTIFTIPSVTLADAGSYTIRVFAPCGAQTAWPVDLVVNSSGPPPTPPASITITEHPTSQTGCTGGSITFRVRALGDNISSIRWRKNGTIIPGLASGAAYTIAPLSSADEGEYDVVLTNASGSVTSSKATLTVQPGASITTHPVGQTVCFGGSATFRVVVSGSATGYQWRKNGNAIPGASNATYTIANVGNTDIGQYDVQVFSCGSQTSNSASLAIKLPVTITSVSATEVICAGGTASFNVTVSGSVTGFQWRKNGVNIPGATSNPYNIPNATAQNAGNYDVVVSGECGSATSSVVPLSFLPSATITGQPSGQTVCSGSSATFRVTVTGDATGYQWRKNGSDIPGATDATFTLPSVGSNDAGQYDVQVFSACGTLSSNPASLIIKPVVTITGQPTSQSICSGGSVTFRVTASGDITGYQWRKNGTVIPNATSNTLTINGVDNTYNGNYDVIVSGSCGNVTSGAATLAVNAVFQLTTSVTPVSCFQGNNGQASVTVVGGSGNYTYRWNNNATTATINGLTAGTYSVVVTDALGCSKDASVTVNQPTQLVTTTNNTAVKCFGGNDGTATVTASGGTSPYTYRWNTGATTSSISGLVTGTYQVTVTDGNGCQQTNSVTINQPTQLVLTTSNSAVKCFGGNDGIATVNANGGSASYTYRWSTGSTTSSISGLTTGTYQVTVTDGNGCAQTASVQVGQPATLLTLATSTTAAKCFNNRDGAANVTATGGGTTYTYQWNTGANTPAISGLAAGAYSVQVTDNNGCVKSASVDISQPTQLVLTTSNTAVKCFGGADGTATVTATGSVGNYVYNWSNGATTSAITSLTAGIYSVRVTDANGCQQTSSVDVAQPTRLLLSLQKDDVKCFGGNDGKVTPTATGGVGNYAYVWNTGATTPVLSGLVTGTYQLTITDANSCIQTASVQVGQPATLLTLATSTTAAKCFNNRDGAANVTATGGGTAYTYQWNTGANTLAISGLAAGAYSVQVTDNNGCVKSASVDITQPTQLVLTTSNSAVKCFGGSDGTAAVIASGSVGNYVYNWSNGATTSAIASLTAGSYSVRVSDANGCLQTSSVDVAQPTRLVLSLQKDDVKCFGGNDGKVTPTATGGVGNYAYVWNTGATTPVVSGLVTGTYQLTITDANSCVQTAFVQVDQPTAVSLSITSTAAKCFQSRDGVATVTATGGVGNYTYRWTSGATSPSATVMAGTYSVDVSDANGCTKTASTEVTQPASITLTTNLTAAKCFNSSDGSVTVSATGGVGTYTYRWSNGGTTPALTGIKAGTYSVDVTDANSCVKTASIDITQPTQLVLTTSNTAVKCFGGNTGTAAVTASGSVGNYTYSWNTGATTSAIASLTAGNYEVTVTDDNSCQQKSSVEVKQPTQLLFTLEKENVKCFGGSDGKVSLNATGGVAGYQVLVNGNSTAFTGGGQHVQTGLTPASYQLAVTDANACQTTAQTVVIEQPKQALAVTLVKATDPRGFGLTDGSISVAIAGGTPQYQTSWKNGTGASVGAGQSTNGGSANELTQLGDETYTLTIQDANYSLATQKEGCTATITQRLKQPPKLTLSLKTTQPVSCFGRKDAQILATADGGVPMSTADKYTFKWMQQTGGTYTSLTLTGSTIQNLPAGNYRCIVTDKNDITQQTDLILTEPTKLVASTSGVTNNLCYNDQKGTAAIQMQGGTQPYRVDWSNGASGQSLNNLRAGRYLAIVSDQNGCSAEVSVKIQEPTALEVSVLKKLNPTCDAKCDGSIQTTAKGGMLPYAYSWNNGQTATSLTNLCGGNYTLTVKDANGCQVATPAVQLVTPAPKKLNVSADRTLCEGQTLQLDATQPGTNTYKWTLPVGGTSTTPQQTITQAGQYVVSVTDSAGCSAQNSFTIRVTPMATQLTFLIASQGVVNDTIVVVNVSSGSTQFEWLVPPSARVLSKTDTRLTFICPQPGAYKVGLRGSNGTCEAEVYKTITIKPAAGRQAAFAEATATALVVYPNPSAGQFRVQIDFGVPTTASLSLIDIRSGLPLYTTQLAGQSSYDQPVDVPDLPTGTYIVQINTSTQQLSKRIIVTR